MHKTHIDEWQNKKKNCVLIVKIHIYTHTGGFMEKDRRVSSASYLIEYFAVKAQLRRVITIAIHHTHAVYAHE